ncbi:MAG: cobalt-precorrin 5A hydrolase [Deltaproteobacteria bacterium]|nr:cobalt-precorrin 5A hydrolase [Deltaproteobacteria bacterium]
MNLPDSRQLAIWAITSDGLSLALKLRDAFPGVVHVPGNLLPCPAPCFSFSRLADCVKDRFSLFKEHVFIMSTGIVVRVIAPCIASKTKDPAVVVMDEKGRHVISLLSGHIGGANRLAMAISEKLQAAPVITTATDLHQVPAIDVIAVDNGLFIENPEAIKTISMAFLNQIPVYLHDPYHWLDKIAELDNMIPQTAESMMMGQEEVTKIGSSALPGFRFSDPPEAVVVVDDRLMRFPDSSLILRPKSLIAGMGCNRNTSANEIREFLVDKLIQFGLSLNSLKCIATIDIKSDEAGLLEVARSLHVPIRFFTREELSEIDSPNPSDIVNKHIGVPSVCEAAAVLASEKGELIVPKQISPNVTLAIARINSTLSD